MKLLLLWDHYKSLDREVHVMKEREKSKRLDNGDEPAEPDVPGPRRLKRPTDHSKPAGSTRKHERRLYTVPEEGKLGSSLTGLLPTLQAKTRWWHWHGNKNGSSEPSPDMTVMQKMETMMEIMAKNNGLLLEDMGSLRDGMKALADAVDERFTCLEQQKK
jgi:hypothetical protein